MQFFKRIYLLVWKNVLFRKKHRSATAWLIILPTLISAGIGSVGIIDQIGQNMDRSSRDRNSNSGSHNDDDYSGSRHPKVNVIIIEQNISNNPASFIEPLVSSSDMIEIAFAPSNYKTKPIMEKLQTALQSISMSKPVVVKLIPYQSDAALEQDLNSWKTGKKPPDFSAAVIFREDLTVHGVYPYTIRMKGVDFYTELLLIPSYGQFLHRSRPNRDKSGHYSFSDRLGPKNLYEKSGFRALQILIDQVIVQEKLKRSSIPVPRMELQGFPFNDEYKYYSSGDTQESDFNQYGDSPNSYYIYVIVLSFILCVPNIIRGIIHEKQTGTKELMKMMGLSNWMHWTGWMIDSLSLLLIVLLLMTFWLFTPFVNKGMIECNVTLWLFILILFLLATVTSLFFISTFFGKPTLAIIAGFIFYILSYFGLVFVLDTDDVFAASLSKKLASSLFPNMAFHWALKIIFDRDTRGAPASWFTITEPLSALDKLNLLAVCGMLVVDSILYKLLTLYFESVIPSEFGLTKPWYYPFLLSTWYSPKKVMPIELGNKNVYAEADSIPGFEEEPKDLPIGIEIRNLCKTFGNKKVAVDGLSAKMFAGEVTALLGHNGAGKTTTLSILTGLYKPSSGTAFINGYNIVNQIDQVRKSVGLGPQHDLLFDELTVAQHLQFFGRLLKGLSSSMAKQEAQRILFSLKLGEKSSNLASTLSGGQKRRLSLANSIIGGSSVLFLDEPTSGLDPEARREVWDLLLALRTEGRTIVLTTHFMEEADVLGDRILIMAEGKLQCSGTPLFLKKCFGDGYTLTVTLTDKVDKNAILSIVQKYISTASLKKGETKSVSEVAITLPEESTKTSIFPDMFSDLTKQQQKLGILTMGLTIPSIDDVFVRVGELSHPIQEKDAVFIEEDRNNFQSVEGSSLFSLMFWGLMIKLFIRNIRNLRLVLLQILPVVAIAIVVAAVSLLLFHGHVPDYPSLKISLRSYADPITLCMPMTKEADFMCDKFFETIKGIGTTKKVGRGSLPGMYKYLEAERDNPDSKELYDFKYIIAAEMKYNGFNNDMVIKVFHSAKYSHSEPLALNAGSNTILKLTQGRADTRRNAGKIEITNHPLRTKGPTDIVAAAEYTFLTNSFYIIMIMGGLLPLPFAMLAASFLMFPSEERVCKGKHLQLMTGVSPFLYWITSILSDFVMMILVACGMLICFVIIEPLGLYTSGYGAGVFFLIFMVYTFSVMPLSYLRSNFGSVASEGFSGLVLFHAFTDPCNDGIAKCGSIAYCYGKLPYLTWLHEANLHKMSRGFTCYEAADSKMVGIGQEVFWMFFFGLVYYILLFMMEYGILARIKNKFRPQKFLVEFQANYPTDEDVIAEALRVHATVFRPQSQLVANMNPITDSAFMAPPQDVVEAEMLKEGW